MNKAFVRAIENVLAAEKMAPVGGYEHGRYVQTALFTAWPAIRAEYELQVALLGNARVLMARPQGSRK